MLKEKIILDSHTLISFDFANLEELLNYIETTDPEYRYWGHSLSSRKNDYNFNGSHSLEEAVKLCRFSDMGKYADLFESQDKFDFNCQNIDNKRKGTLRQYGYRPNIARSMVGHPMQMYHIERDTSRKFINIFFNCSVPAYTSQKIICNKGIITLNLIKMLELLNYRVNLNFFELSYVGNEWCLIKINIKKFDEKIDPNICYFPMVHPSFLRRILFAVKETTSFENSYWRDSYGRVPDTDEVKTILDISDNDIVISGNLHMCGDLIDDAQTFIREINLTNYFDKGQDIIFDAKTKKFVLRKK